MDEKKKKISAIVAVLLVAIIAIVVAVVVDKNNKEDKQPDGQIVDQIEDQEGSEGVDEIELEVDNDGNVIVVPNDKESADNKNNQNDKDSKKPSDKESQKPNENQNNKPNDNGSNDSSNNGSDNQKPSTPDTPSVEVPEAISGINFSYVTDNNVKYLVLKWQGVKADGYEVRIKNANEDDNDWKEINTNKTSVRISVVDLSKIGKELVFSVAPFNKDASGNKVYATKFVSEKQVLDTSDIDVPERNVTVDVVLPSIIEDSVLTIYVNGEVYETRQLLTDEKVENPDDRRETFDLGVHKGEIEVTAKLVSENRNMEESKIALEEKVIINLRNKDIERLPEFVE